MPKNGNRYTNNLIVDSSYYGPISLVDKQKTQKAGRLTFSFRFFNADFDYFQLGGENAKWFKSLFNTLQDISENITKNRLQTDISVRNKYRFHKINWEQSGLRIAKEDLSWVDSSYLNNEAEFEFVQLSISRAKGRIIGFFDTCNNFQIVLLDPKHNMQPCQKSNYTMVKTDNCLTEIEVKDLCLDKIKKIIQSQRLNTGCSSCKLFINLKNILRNQTSNNNDEVHIYLTYHKDFEDAYARLIIDNPNYFQNLFECDLFKNIG